MRCGESSSLDVVFTWKTEVLFTCRPPCPVTCDSIFNWGQEHVKKDFSQRPRRLCGEIDRAFIRLNYRYLQSLLEQSG